MKIIILTKHQFPNGLAQTNRLIALCKGLIHSGCIIKLVCVKATEIAHEVKNREPEGIFEGIPFVYTTKTTVRPKNVVQRILIYYKGIIQSFVLVIKENNLRKIDVVFCPYTDVFSVSILYLITRILKVKLIHERSEYPFLSFKGGVVGTIKKILYQNYVLKLFDGYIVITNALKRYFQQYANRKAKYFILPILIEAERFNIEAGDTEDYVAYCGSMQGDKDGVDILIKAFSEVRKSYPSLKLYLIGNTQFNGVEKLQRIISDLELNDNVVFTGQVNRERLAQYLCGSQLLLLSRPNNKQAEGGFPTKLGEYLASRVPVVVTKVGEIPAYLDNKINAYLAEPNNIDDFAKKMIEALDHYDESKRVGNEGRILAETVFNHEYQGIKLKKWIEQELLDV